MKKQINKCLVDLFKKLSFVREIKRGIVPLESIKHTQMPILSFNTATTTDSNEEGIYNRNILTVVINAVIVDKETNEDRYYDKIDEYVDEIVKLLYENEQYCNNVYSTTFSVDEQVNDTYLDGLIVLVVTITTKYYEEY